MVIQKREANAPLTPWPSAFPYLYHFPIIVNHHTKNAYLTTSEKTYNAHIWNLCLTVWLLPRRRNSFTIPPCLSFSDNWLIKHCNNNSKNNNKYKFKSLITLILFISDFHINDHSSWTCEVSFFWIFEKCLGCKCLASIVKISFYGRAEWKGLTVALSA